MLNKNVLVVGAAKGIGEKVVNVLLGDGFNVWAIDRLALALPQQDTFHSEIVDLLDRTVVDAYVHDLAMQGCRFHAVVLCAGVHGTDPFEHITDANLDLILNTNFTAQMKFLRDIIPLMSTDSRIIALSSIGATIGLPTSAIYSASKAALELVFEALTIELSDKKIHPIIVQPGNVNTGFNETGNRFPLNSSAYLTKLQGQFVEKINSKFGMSVTPLANKILSIIKMKRPSNFYLYGLNARKAFWSKRILGKHWSLVILKKLFIKI